MFGSMWIYYWLKARSSELVILKDNTMWFCDDIVLILELKVLKGAAGSQLKTGVFALKKFEDLRNFESEEFLVKARF